ncbi:polyketide synthase [Aspergillus luchuensis]|uniref:Polyketide synthase n=1 Tax=Aspergillus kawachii TaxID=1069201 RepID=A0A146FZW1_ASPKA|nr:polyketide synthase [Aspergillus luchuensis]
MLVPSSYSSQFGGSSIAATEPKASLVSICHSLLAWFYQHQIAKESDYPETQGSEMPAATQRQPGGAMPGRD